MKRKITILTLILTLFCSLLAPISVSAETETPTYTVIVLDTSGEHKFYSDTSGKNLIYTAESAIDEVKTAAIEFSTKLLSLNKNHYISIVSSERGATTVCKFTQDTDYIAERVQKLKAGGEDISITSTLVRARNLFAEVYNNNIEKNIVIFSTGLNNSGTYNYSGKYDKTTPASNWLNIKSKVHLYAYSNSAVKEAQNLHATTDIYTIGLLQNWNGMPADGRALLTFFELFLKDLCNTPNNFYPVYKKSDLDEAFAQVGNDIIDNPFDDTTYQSYFWDAVIWAGENGITTGTSADSFTPDEICTREQMVTFLWRAAGTPEPTSTTTRFVDLDPGASWSYKAICWADEEGITKGTSDTTFSPKSTVTREQVVTLLWRLDGSKQVSSGNPFKDIAPGQYSYEAILWALENGITTGVNSTSFGPASPCTRAQIVTFLYRYYTQYLAA